MDFDPDSRNEAQRLLGIAEKLLDGRDLAGAREFATLAQETDPLLDGSDQMLAIAEVLLASEKRVNSYYYDWYAVLQMEQRSEDPDLIKKHYRRLALLLHPDKNKYPGADQAFSLVSEAWAVLSDPTRKPVYDRESGVSVFYKVDLPPSSKLPVKRNAASAAAATDPILSSFWTGCPYCYRLYEYPRLYEECCLRCQNCKRAFHAVLIPSLPPLVPGSEAYYCSWGPLPFGFVPPPGEAPGGQIPATTTSNWMPPPPPPPFPGYLQQQPPQQPPEVVENVKTTTMNQEQDQAPRKRGRPRKNPV